MSLTIKLLVISEVVLLVAVMALLLPVWLGLRNQVVHDLQHELQSIASTAALQLDPAELASVRTMADARSPAFVHLRDTLRRVRDANGLSNETIYTFYRDGADGVRFGVMTHPEPFVGAAYPLRPEMRVVFDEGRVSMTGLYNDAHGAWISAYAPIKDADGKVISLLEVDRPAEAYFTQFHFVTRLAAGLGLVALALSSLLGWLVLNSVLIRPLRAVREGMMALARRDFLHRVKLQTRDELQDLGEALNHIAQELNVARDVQSGFNPKHLPQQAGYRIAAATEPCEATAGDYFDAFALDDRRTVVLVADVTGHGLGPSLLMSACRSALRALTTADLQPSEVIARLDALLESDLQDGRFITMILGVLEADGDFTFTNAGHGPAMVVVAGRVMRLGAHRPPLGIGIELEGEDFQTTIHLEDGDRVFLASDGVNEAMDAAGEQFGNERIETIVGDASLDCDEVVQRVREELEKHCGGPKRKDDVTILCVDRGLTEKLNDVPVVSAVV